MKPSIFYSVIISSVILCACKTTQPAGIYEKARGATTAAGTNYIKEPVQATPPAQPSVQETGVRQESFTLATTETNSDPLTKKYSVVVGSFSSQQNARNLSQKLKSEGKNPSIVVNENSMFRVIIASYNTYKEATNARIALQNRFSDAWLLIQAPK